MSHARRIVSSMLVSVGCPAAVFGQFDDTIRVQLTLEEGRMHVETRFPPTDIAIPRLALWPWAGADFVGDVEDLEAFDEEGQRVLITPTGPDEWQVPLGGGAFSLRYTVRAWKFTFSGDNRPDIYRPLLIEDRAIVGGRAWFLQPGDAELALAPVRITVGGSYPDATVLGGVDGVLRDARYVAGSLVVAGDVRRRTTTVDGVPIRFHLYGDRWRFSDDDLVEAVENIVRDQADDMGFLPGDGLEVVLIEGAEAFAGGIADGNIITLYPDQRLRLSDRDPQTLRLIAHEHFHRWLGEYAISDPLHDEGRYKWFQEGVTEYMAYRTLLRTGYVESGDFVFKINQYISRYLENPAAFTATADVLERDYWDHEGLQDLAYDKGFLIGLALDALIRRDSYDGAGIEDFVRGVIGSDGPVEYDDSYLLGALDVLTESSWQEFYDAYMLGSEPLPIDEICQVAGFDCRRDRGGPLQLHPTNRTRRSVERLMR